MSNTADYGEIINLLEATKNRLDRIVDTQTGRDTHPLYDEEARPMDLHIASTVEGLRARVYWLQMEIENYIRFKENG